MDPVAQLGQLLRDVDYSGPRHVALIKQGLPPAAVLNSLGRDADARLITLAALFDREETIATDDAAAALQPLTVDELVGCGLLERDGGDVRATTRLLMFDDAIVAGDPLRAAESPDYVVALSSASVRMASLVVRRSVASALDLGTGSGIQALLAARHADRVVAVDVNRRALDMAAWSARLNGVENVDWREGDWLEPVRGEVFDLVIANPAVIVSPDAELLWRDSPLGGEELSRRLVAGCAQHLGEGGYATICCHWTHTEDRWSETPAEWASGLGCDAVLLHFDSHDPLSYALHHVGDGTAAAGSVERWVTHYAAAGVERIATGAVVLRRTGEAANWVRTFQLDKRYGPSGGVQLEQVFAIGDALAARPGADGLAWLMSGAWRPLSGDSLDQVLVHRDGSFASVGGSLRREPGMGLAAWLDPRVVPAVLGCDGRRTLAQVLGAVESPDVRGACLSTIRELIARGLLVREEA